MTGRKSCLTIAIAFVIAVPISAAGAMPLAPHRAIYDLVLDPERSSTQVDRARGRIAFQFTGNACDGYTITLRQVTSLDTGEGQETVSDLRSETFEDGRATTLRFKTQNYINQQLREDVNGQAARRKDGAFTVKVAKPKPANFALRGPIVLPTEHTRQMLAAAERGQRILSARVYDGSPDGRKIYDTLTVVGDPILPDSKDAPPRAELSTLKRYPVTVSYFETGTGERTPAYTLAFDLYENGVSGALRLNYGNFALKGMLSSVELLPAKPCKQ